MPVERRQYHHLVLVWTRGRFNIQLATPPSFEKLSGLLVLGKDKQHADTYNEERGLSKYAAEQIHKHIVQPILREDSLKEFH